MTNNHPIDMTIHTPIPQYTITLTGSLEDIIAAGRLIAAAPDLLEACKVVGSVTGPASLAKAQRLARAAIAKATGGAE